MYIDVLKNKVFLQREFRFYTILIKKCVSIYNRYEYSRM